MKHTEIKAQRHKGTEAQSRKFFVPLLLCAFVPVLLIFFAGCSSDKSRDQELEINAPKTEPCQPANVEISNSQSSNSNLKLNFQSGDLTTYRLITENQRQANWEGSQAEKPASFVGGLTRTRTEITFRQLVKQVYNSGNAQLQITITGLKYQSIVRDVVTSEYDNTNIKSSDNPLSKLIGLSYSIEVTPSGEVIRIVDADKALTGFMAANSGNKVVISLLSSDAIKERHTIKPLVAARNKQLQKGDSFTTAETISFDLMGNRTYEKTYSLNDIIEEPSGERTAVITMRAASQPEKPAVTISINNNEAYTGIFKLELTKSWVLQNREELAVEWEIRTKADQPVSMRVSATKLYDCEMIK
jgi:hypothetical protein